MRRLRVLLAPLVLAMLVGCGDSAAPGGSQAPRPTAAPTRVPPTAAPTAVNYVALRTRLLTPLGALIIATRENNATQMAFHLNTFNTEAGQILPVIERDMSTNANRLNSAIANTRDAAARRDVTALEAQRTLLLQVQ